MIGRTESIAHQQFILSCHRQRKEFIMSSSRAGSRAVDEARQALCREVARCINSGSFTVRVRVTTSADRPIAARIEAHHGDGWKKQFAWSGDPALVLALDETLAMLASTKHRDEWSAERRAHSDGYELDLQFHPEKFKDRLGSNLESVLTGLLFRDSHDSKKDSRRSIRTPRPKRASK
jgi:hypothetical protein